MSVQTKIPCPECGSDIYIDSRLLIAGERFSCSNPNCQVSISLDPSSTHQVETAFSEFEKLKQESIQMANGGND